MIPLRHLTASIRWCIAFRRSNPTRGAAATSCIASAREEVPLRGWVRNRLKPIHQLLALLFALPAAAGPLLTPSTTTYGGIVSGGNFTTGIGTNTFVLPSNSWPLGQGPTEAVDGVIGTGSKYLNLNISDTALIFSGTTARVAERLELWVAEDSVERDPASYTLYGTNTAIPTTLGTAGNTIALSNFNFTQISTGTLTLPATRNTTPGTTGLSQSIPIPNTTAYASYLLVFPTVKNAPTAANSMQISEVQLYDSGIIGVEQFDYADGSIAAKNGGTFWNYDNISPTGPSGAASDWDNVTAAPTVASGRLVTQNSSAKREYNGPGEGFPPSDEANGAVNEANVAKSVYYRVTATTGATVPITFGLSSYDFFDERLFFGKTGFQPKFTIEEAGVSFTSSTLPDILPNTTYTLVARLNYATDSLALWVNPVLNADETSQLPAVTRTYTGTNWSTAVRLFSTGGSPVTWDDLVVATSWDDLGTVVDTVTDEDNGNLIGSVSLREAVKYSPTGSLITFAPNLSGGTITLTHADGDMEIPQALTIDASALPGGLTVSGNNTSRHFFVGSGKSLTLRGLTLTGGNGSGPLNNNGSGGAINNDGGTLTLTQCTLSGNSANNIGGAIYNQLGTATLSQCTLSGNSANSGGAINSNATLTLTQCTLSGNSANFGGAISNQGGTLTLTNSIVAGNSLTGVGSGADISNANHLTRIGANIVQSLVNDGGSSVNGSGTIINADPRLSPLGYFGGPVQTMHPLIGSPAIDAAGTTNPGGTDARGFPRFVDGDPVSSGTQLDIGAVEAGPLSPVNNAAGDSSSGTLRSRIAALTEPGTRITFSPALAGQTILLGGTQLDIPATAGLFIDASNLTAPVTISGNNQSRVFNIPATATVAMHSLRIVGGSGDDGGGILNAGTCTVVSSTLSGNSATLGGGGGGIGNNGICAVISSTLSGNSAHLGGGIRNNGTCAVLLSTFSGNSGTSSGGGIQNSGTCTVLSSTFSGNSTSTGGGGIQNNPISTFHLTASIVAGNTGLAEKDVSGSFNTNTNNLIGGTPLLAPLGDYGGPTQTMPPLPGSPALDAATATTAQTDQRGFPRSRDGDGNGTALPDIGAVESGLIAVTNTADAGPGSLRQAVLEAAAQPGPDTVYFTAAVTGPITLTTEILITDATGGVTIDASDRPTGQTISGSVGTPTRLFQVQAGKSLTLRGLTLTGGNSGFGDGGAVFSAGTLLVDRCTFVQNTCNANGGAIGSTGTLTGTHSTFAGNTSTRSDPNFGGGAISCTRPTRLTHCTLADNSATRIGGAILLGENAITLTLENTIVAGNAAAAGPDVVRGSGFIITTGVNLIGNLANSDLTAGPTVLTGDAKLSPLGSYGGPTQTMPPLAGSPAIDAAGATSAFTTDQRGLARVVDGNNSGTAQTDIGAVESAIRFVTNNNDSGSGSLRQALLDAAAAPGWEAIAFVPALNAGTISLTSTHPEDGITGIVITDTDGVAIDASSLSGGLTITKPAGDYRLFRVDGGRLSLHQLTLTGGSVPTDFGGAVTNASGTLSLSDCTLTGNTARDGGAIFSNSDVISTGRFTEVRRCTLTGNTATGQKGGAIRNSNGKTIVLFSTITGNTAPGTSGGGIASSGNTATLTEVTSSIVSANPGGDVVFTDQATNSFLSRGHNLIGTGNGTGNFNQTGDLINNADPLLAPLANYGGPTRTMPPLRGSPAIDASAAASAGPADQRGLPRVVDGNNSGTAQTDIGAVESAFRFVTTTTDNASTPAAGSLRKALIDAAAQPGWEAIAFASSVTPQITLASEIVITDPAGVMLDATDRPTGLLIDGGSGTNRHFRIDAGTTAVFQRLKLTGGNGVGTGAPANYGGSIYNGGTLTLRECTLSGNTVNNVGGAIYSGGGPLTIERSTLSGNSATGGGGAITHESLQLLTLTSSTLANNTAGFEAGAINAPFGRPVLLVHCTISGNRVLNTGANGVGGVRGVPSGSVTVRDSIISGNIDPNASGTPDINAGFISPGTNIIGGNAFLAPLADYGGPTPTMALRPGSPARNTATGTPAATSDQRGFPIVGVKDRGAYEAGTAGNTATTLAETLPGTGPASSITPEADYDSDGSSNQDEIIAGTLPANPTSVFRPLAFLDEGDLIIEFPTLTGRTYTLQRSDTLAAASWMNTVLTVTGNGTTHGFRLPFTPGVNRRFYRIVVSQP